MTVRGLVSLMAGGLLAGSVPPAPRDNPTLDSLILRQAPVRLQPGTLTPRL
ncbi:hypothetical protein GJ689_01315 [Rhodoplanes serenus]|uniref:Uncharacterized protein n=1 Tax=Rhodoplanes serenus TaxID=200615 RepID=A0A9X4XHY3_9BRAD|nr:hypothetical protein [Rhodoplanes serenus]MTW14857.1 hypothetical protein [Rhodoplanes serenus]